VPSRSERHASIALRPVAPLEEDPTLGEMIIARTTETTGWPTATRTLINPLMSMLSKKYSSLPDDEATRKMQDLMLGITLQEAKATIGTSMTCL
jgi:hypothetical protein